MKLRWGILGTGNIAGQFAQAMKYAHRGELVAVGSRNADASEAFGQAHGIAHRHGTYPPLLEDPHVDAVYVSLPNSLHHEWTIRALRAGKHVLCEKPIAASREQAAEMFHVARDCGRVLVEAFMYRSHPLTSAWLEKIRSGAIGRVLLVRSSFCFCTARREGNIRFRRELAGGALMDVGCYCINLSRLVAATEPTVMTVQSKITEGGVDEISAGTLQFADGILASFACGMTVHADNTAVISGSEGYLEIPVPWKPPPGEAKFVLSTSVMPLMDAGKMRLAAPAPGSNPKQVFTVEMPRPAYAQEADDFAAVVFDGARPVISEADSLGNMAVLDEMRRIAGIL